MRLNHISQHDLEEDMRLDAATEDLSQIKVARIERSGTSALSRLSSRMTVI